MKTVGYISAFLGGAIAGAAIGLLLAPEKGTDTRKKISGTIEDFCEKHKLKLTRKEIEEFADDLELAGASED
ncbi:MAG: YtxH domain-containing protein [Prevotella sp.]|uniref:YtxH domain-containing protein n=1 Tax=Prevotella sp. TaxID=59823 RepID=UPI002A3222A9|nr:YtxH domain-containing protein [Prevotella sp.]MDD7318701.1 YtxH domain-containing protein [Prevotellaceae bacterium]MDY4019344.1 YtxH domain-containing protein [Prevotella sp.]